MSDPDQRPAVEDRRQPLPPGTVLSGYEIRGVLGAGGFAITYAATQPGESDELAIKEFMPIGLASRAPDGIGVRTAEELHARFTEELAAFEAEARTVAALNHPAIVPVTRLFRANGTAYIAMPRIEGTTLAKALQNGTPPSEQWLADLVHPIIEALDHMHRRGVIHRDLKPGNVLVRPDGSPVLIDFGAARADWARNAGLPPVSAGYAAPEHYERDTAGAAVTDIYSLGAILYRAVSGTVPPDARERLAGARLIPARVAAAGPYSEAFLTAIDAALALDRDRRPESASAFWQQLTGKRRTAPVDTDRAPRKRMRLPWLAAAAGLVALGMAIGVAARLADRAETARGTTTALPRAVVEPVRLEVGQRFTDCEGCPIMVVLPAGALPDGGKAIDRPFAMGAFEVTRAQFAIFVDATRREMRGGCNLGAPGGVWQRDLGASWREPRFRQNALHPVVCVSWIDARDYAAWLARKTGKRYRLPRGHEWEYAARAGSGARYWWGEAFSPRRANCIGCVSPWEGRGTAPIGSFPSNTFGLHEVLGNVAEWTLDCAGRESASCQRRIVRGGHWAAELENTTVTNSRPVFQDVRSSRLGFRLLREIDAGDIN